MKPFRFTSDICHRQVNKDSGSECESEAEDGDGVKDQSVLSSTSNSNGPPTGTDLDDPDVSEMPEHLHGDKNKRILWNAFFQDKNVFLQKKARGKLRVEISSASGLKPRRGFKCPLCNLEKAGAPSRFKVSAFCFSFPSQKGLR
jgi:hypothetical protein